jgi:cysteine desulfurase family protein
MNRDIVYLDNAATSFPKPDAVYRAADAAMRECGNPGRAGHRLSVAAGRAVEDARVLLARLFNIAEPRRVCFTLNATDALNLAIKGVLKPGDHAVITSMEHNAVVRPLEALKHRDISYTKVATSPLFGTSPDDVAAAIRGDTRLVIINHVSNVTGTVNDIAAIGHVCRERGVPMLVDASQSAGARPIDVQAMNIDLFAFPGHKGLLGPQGTGGLYIREGIEVAPLREGGTGTRSESRVQPEELPERYESGTMNAPGLAGLAAGVRYILDAGVNAIFTHETELTNTLIHGLNAINGVHLFGPPAGLGRGGVVSFTVDGLEPQEVALALDSAFNIAVRSGLHCAPDAHEMIGTLGRGGTVRASVGIMNTRSDIDACLRAVEALSGANK